MPIKDLFLVTKRELAFHSISYFELIDDGHESPGMQYGDAVSSVYYTRTWGMCILQQLRARCLPLALASWVSQPAFLNQSIVGNLTGG